MQILRNLFFVLCVQIAFNLSSSEAFRLKRSFATCGNPARQAGFIVGGNRSVRGEFPWLVAVMLAEASPPSLIGGGTLISDRHVITAAHCVKPKDGSFSQLFPPDVIAQFGAFNLNNLHELGKTSLAPEQIIVHQDWDSKATWYDADIAIMIFERGGIPINKFIQPVCLWTSETAPSETEGVVAGWGKSEDKSKAHEEIPKKVKLRVRTNEDCLLKSPGLVKLFSKRTFCAGVDEDGSGVCLGDSGNGLVVQQSDISYLRGIVSSSLLAGTTCDVSNYAIYSDVLKFIPWIMEIANEGGSLLTAVKPEPVKIQSAPVVLEPVKKPEEEDLLQTRFADQAPANMNQLNSPLPTTPAPTTPEPTTPVPTTPVPSNPVPSAALPSNPVPNQPLPNALVPNAPIASNPLPNTPMTNVPLPNQPLQNAPPVTNFFFTNSHASSSSSSSSSSFMTVNGTTSSTSAAASAADSSSMSGGGILGSPNDLSKSIPFAPPQLHNWFPPTNFQQGFNPAWFGNGSVPNFASAPNVY